MAPRGTVSVADLTSWVIGTANQITSTSNGSGATTISIPTDAILNIAKAIITAATAGDIPLTLKAAASQTADLLSITDSSDNELFTVNSSGFMNNVDGIRTVTNELGPGLAIQAYGETIPEHTNQSGWYDHTGGANGEQIFTKTSGDDFTTDDAANGSFLLITDASYIGALCEVKSFISATQVIVDGFGWSADIGSGGSPVTFLTAKHPSFVSGAGFKHEFSVGSGGEFEVASYGFTGGKVVEIELDAAANNIRAAHVEAECNGYNNIVGQEVHVVAGDLSPDESVAGIYTHVDVSGATSADSTTSVPCYIAGVENGSDATTKAFLVLAGFDKALQVYGATEDDPDYGYEVTGGVVVDRVNGGTADTTAFLAASASDLAIMDSDNDYILLGSDSTFEIVNVHLDTGSSKDCDLDFFYSKAGGNWTALTVIDTTDGLRNNGEFNFNAPVDWTKDDEAETNGDITDAYYIKAVRTYGPVIPTLPVEDYFKLRANKAAGMEIRGDGTISPASMADASAENESLYYSTTQSKLVYKDSGGTVNDLY